MNEEVKNDVYENLTKSERETVDALLENLEKGAGLWEQGWQSIGAPENPVSGSKFHGSNNIILTVLGMLRGYNDNRWVTFNQIREQRWKFKTDENGNSLGKDAGVGISFYTVWDRATHKRFDASVLEGMTFEEQEAYRKENVYSLKKSYTVFNGELIDGIPQKEKREFSLEGQNARLDQLLELWNEHAAKIFYGGDQAYYIPGLDEVHLPPRNRFYSMPEFYSTALHEVGHSTGHESRLNRELKGGFGSSEYATEELRAEIASMFLEQEFEVPTDPEHIRNNSAYIEHWYLAIKNDPSVLFAAIKDADKIAKFVCDKEKEYSSENVRTDLYGQTVRTDEVPPLVSSVDSAGNFAEATPAIGQEMSGPKQAEGRGVQGGTSPLAENAAKVPTVLCEWSESAAFEEGKVYSVSEFDKRMMDVEREMQEGKKAAIEHYGSEAAWYASDEYDEYTKFMGYDKVKFTLYLPDGRHFSERQDVGDGIGGLLDFLSQYEKYNTIMPELRKRVELEESMRKGEKSPAEEGLQGESAPLANDGKGLLTESYEALAARIVERSQSTPGETIYGAVGDELGQYSEAELATFISDKMNAKTAVRYWLETQITEAIINDLQEKARLKAEGVQGGISPLAEGGAEAAADDENKSESEIYMLPSKYAEKVYREQRVDMSGRGLDSLTRLSDRAVVEKAMRGGEGEKFKSLYEGLPVLGAQEVDEDSLMCRIAIYAEDRDQLMRIFKSSGQYREGKSEEHYEALADDAMKYIDDRRKSAETEKKPDRRKQRQSQSSR